MARSQRHLRDVYGIDSSNNNSGPTNDPKILTAPSIAGSATNGQTLTGTNGTSTGPGTITTTRQWLRGTTPISGATNATYVLTGADVGHVIRFRNIVSNQFGSVNNDSSPTIAVT
jgi:hypothetical protein